MNWKQRFEPLKHGDKVKIIKKCYKCKWAKKRLNGCSDAKQFVGGIGTYIGTTNEESAEGYEGHEVNNFDKTMSYCTCFSRDQLEKVI